MGNRQVLLVTQYQDVSWMNALLGLRRFEYFEENGRFGVIQRWFKEGCLWKWFLLQTLGIRTAISRPVRISPTEDQVSYFASEEAMMTHREDNLIAEKSITQEISH